MKQLQKDYTTTEQSKRLLELGLPAWTANIMFDINRRRYELIETEDESWTETQRTLFYSGGAIPHWSVGRLMEIAHICSNSTLSYKEEANEIQKFKEEHKCKTLIEAVIECIADAVSISNINFSKLEG